MGHAFHPNFPKGKLSGVLTLQKQGLLFSSNQEHPVSPLLITYTQLRIERGGASNRLLFFKSIESPDISFFTADFDLLNDPSWPQIESIQAQIQANQAQKRSQALTLVLTLLLLLGGIGALLFVKDPLIDKATQAIPIEWEVKLGQTLFESYLSGKKTIKDQALKDELNQMLAPLLDQVPARTGEFKVELIEESVPNAFALPGGHIVIHSGLILLMDKPEQVLGVLAHEIGHVNRRHHLRHIVNTLGLYTLLSITIGDLSAIGGVLASQGSELMSLKNSRDHEREADDYGWTILTQAHLNPKGLIEAFEHLNHHSKTQQAQIPQFFKTSDTKSDEASKEKTKETIKSEQTPKSNTHHTQNQYNQNQANQEENTKDEESTLSSFKLPTFLSTHPSLQSRIDTLSQRWMKEKQSFKALDFPFTEFKSKLKLFMMNTNKSNSTKPISSP